MARLAPLPWTVLVYATIDATGWLVDDPKDTWFNHAKETLPKKAASLMAYREQLCGGEGFTAREEP